MKSLRAFLLLFALLALPAFAQNVPLAKPVDVKASQPAPAPKATPAEVPLSATESIAIGAIGEKQQALYKQLQDLDSALYKVETDISVNHPGYHFDRPSGRVVKNEPPKASTPTKK